MRWFLILLLTTVTLRAADPEGAWVTGMFVEITNAPSDDRVIFRPRSTPYTQTNMSTVVISPPITTNLYNGEFGIFLLQGLYDVSIGIDTFRIRVPGDGGTYLIGNLATNLSRIDMSVPINVARYVTTNETRLPTVTNYYWAYRGFKVGSNSWPLVPAVPGEIVLGSSNGVPHIVWKDVEGDLRTNDLTQGGSGTTDHGALTGLGDNDHPQYQLLSTILTEITNLIWSVDYDGWMLTQSNGSPKFTRNGGALTNVGGASDHGALTGLGDDDHLQYTKTNQSTGGVWWSVPFTNTGGTKIGGVAFDGGFLVSGFVPIASISVTGAPAGYVLKYDSGSLQWAQDLQGAGGIDGMVLTNYWDYMAAPVQFHSSFTVTNVTAESLVGKLYYDPTNNTFMVGWGGITAGAESFAWGNDANATGGDGSVAMGSDAEATGASSFAFGEFAYAGGVNAMAFGDTVGAGGTRAMAFGYNLTNSGDGAIAFNAGTDAHTVSEDNSFQVWGVNIRLRPSNPGGAVVVHGNLNVLGGITMVGSAMAFTAESGGSEASIPAYSLATNVARATLIDYFDFDPNIETNINGAYLIQDDTGDIWEHVGGEFRFVYNAGNSLFDVQHWSGATWTNYDAMSAGLFGSTNIPVEPLLGGTNWLDTGEVQNTNTFYVQHFPEAVAGDGSLLTNVVAKSVPERQVIYLAPRTDDEAGDGTESNPIDVSTPAKLLTAWNNINTNGHQHRTIVFKPGTYYVSSTLTTYATNTIFSGYGAKIYYTNAAGVTLPQSIFRGGAENCVYEGFDIDCGSIVPSFAGSSGYSGGINVGGDGTTIKDVTIRNLISISAVEPFGILLHCTNGLIANCTVIGAFSPNNNGLFTAIGVMGKNITVSGCMIDLQDPVGDPTDIQTFGLSCYASYCTFVGNVTKGVDAGQSADTGAGEGISVSREGNTFSGNYLWGNIMSSRIDATVQVYSNWNFVGNIFDTTNAWIMHGTTTAGYESNQVTGFSYTGNRFIGTNLGTFGASPLQIAKFDFCSFFNNEFSIMPTVVIGADTNRHIIYGFGNHVYGDTGSYMTNLNKFTNSYVNNLGGVVLYDNAIKSASGSNVITGVVNATGAWTNTAVSKLGGVVLNNGDVDLTEYDLVNFDTIFSIGSGIASTTASYIYQLDSDGNTTGESFVIKSKPGVAAGYQDLFIVDQTAVRTGTTNGFIGLGVGITNYANHGVAFQWQYQPSDADLTNWASLATNTFDSKYQVASANLTNWSGLTTNAYATLFIPAGAMTTNNYGGGPSAITLAPTNALNPAYDAWAFDDAASQTNYFHLMMPDSWNEATTVKIKLFWLNTSTTADKTNCWGIAAAAVSKSDQLGNVAFSTEVTCSNAIYTTSTNALNSTISPEITIGGTPALGDLVWFRIRRATENAFDSDSTGHARLIGAAIQYMDKRNNPAQW